MPLAIPWVWAGAASLVSFVGGYFSGGGFSLLKWLLAALGGYIVYQKVFA
jgi:hypothetical protein